MITLAHEKWFLDPSRYPLQLSGEAWERTALAAGVALLAVGAAFLADRTWRRIRPRPVTPLDVTRSHEDLVRLLAWIPLIMAVHAAVPLLVAGVQRQLFVPNLELPRRFYGGVIGLTEIVVALSFVYGALTRLAALALMLLFPIGSLIFGPAEMAEHLELLGIAVFLFIMGRGPYSLDSILRPVFPGATRWIPLAVPALRVLTGAAIAWLGFTEKLWNIPMALAFLEEHPFNFMPTLGFPGFSNEDFVVAAGVVEVTMGVLIVCGLATRAVILIAWLPFNLSLPFLGWVELVGHLPIYGVMAVLLLWGSGRDVRKYLRELKNQTT